MCAAKKEKKPQRTIGEQVRFTNKVVKDGLKTVSHHHIEAFDYAIGKCLPRVCKYMLPVEVTQIQTQQPNGA
jgi:hypothetical protein